MRFRTLLGISILVPLLVTGLAVMGEMYRAADRNATDVGERLLGSVTAQAAGQVKTRSEHAVSLVRSLRALAGSGVAENGVAGSALALGDSDKLTRELLEVLRANPGITWLSFSNPAGDFSGVYRDAQGRTCTNQSVIRDGKTALVEYVVAADNSRTLLRREADSGYDPRTRPFYVEAAKTPDVVWLPPYIFYGQGIPGISCAAAVRLPGGEVLGVISVDYDLRYLSEFARQTRASPHSEVMVFTPEQILVAHSAVQVVKTTGERDEGKLLALGDVEDGVTATLAKELQGVAIPAEGLKAIAFDFGGERYIACVLPMALESGPTYYVATVAPRTDFAPSAWQSSKLALGTVGVVVILAGLAALVVANRISRPLTRLMKTSERIGKGELDVAVELGSLYEFKRLARALERMLTNLRDWMRVRASLQLAMEIQRNLLPAGPPMVPGFDIAGYSAYCDETGGDYYDYILADRVNPTRLIIALGDVMGHGLPSALMMAGARGILRSAAATHMVPGALLARLNGLLHQDTAGKRFMTMVLVCFDLTEGSCTWASAGHDPPIIYESEMEEFIEPEGGDIPLGVAEDVEYGNYSFMPFHVGQVIFIGSDGVWEMFALTGDQYGKERLKKVIAAHAEESAEEIKQAILASLESFRAGEPQRDDVTFVVVKVTQVLQGTSAEDQALPGGDQG